MNKTKIDWCDSTANPVVGCPNGCAYCYARRINSRFHYVKNWEQPEFKPDVLKKFDSKNAQAVFIDSMSDIGCWRQEWLDEVLAAIVKNPQHMYLALTKTSIGPLKTRILKSLQPYAETIPCTLYLGKSITTQQQMDDFVRYGERCDFLSIEPLLEPLDLMGAREHGNMFDTIIIGAETGNRKGKVIPPVEWVRSIVRQADALGVWVFMKESLRSIMGDEFRQERLPWYSRLENQTKKGEKQ